MESKPSKLIVGPQACTVMSKAGKIKLCRVNSVSTQSQQVSTSINSKSSWLSLSSDKSHLGKLLFKKHCFLAVCGADLGSELTISSLRQKKLLDLSQYIFLFSMHQSSSSKTHCKLKSMKFRKVLSDLSLDNPSFLVIAHMKQQIFCS